jgi:hypothetical protein
MDSEVIKTFCDSAVELLPQLASYGALEPAKRKSEDDSLVRQLRIAALAAADNVVRMTPTPMPPMPTPPNVGAPS